MHKMIGVDEALAFVLDRAVPLDAVPMALEDAVGLVLAESAQALDQHPPFDRAMMDGYAVRVVDAGGRPRVVGLVAAGAPSEQVLENGQCVEIMTGAPCPAGAQAVVKVEETRRDGDRVVLPSRISAGQNIAPQGSECPEGTVVLSAGDIVTPLSAATLAAIGVTMVGARRRPRVAVISTGSELVPPGVPLGAGQIRDSNGLMLSLLAREVGAGPVTVARAADTPEALAAALSAAAEADVVLLSGGVSMGRYDLVPAALAERGAELVFQKVRQKPGKPLLFAQIGRQLVFGLPGNPLSSHVGFHRYVAPALRRLMGRSTRSPAVTGTLATPLHARSDRVMFLLAVAEPANGGFRVSAREGRGSADLFANATANAMIRLEPGTHDLVVGAPVTFEWLWGRRWTE